MLLGESKRNIGKKRFKNFQWIVLLKVSKNTID